MQPNQSTFDSVQDFKSAWHASLPKDVPTQDSSLSEISDAYLSLGNVIFTKIKDPTYRNVVLNSLIAQGVVALYGITTAAEIRKAS